MQTVFHSGKSRGYMKQGWLETHHSFSFASYYNPEKMGFGTLRVINDDVIAAGQGFGRHSHNDMEIITIPLSGALTHEDSMGNIETIQTGEIQIMSAGTGVEHSEYNASKTDRVRLLQIWIETRKNGALPRYGQKVFDQASYKNTFHLVVGPEGSEKNGALSLHQDAFLSLGKFDVDMDIPYFVRKKGDGIYFFVIDGEMDIEGKKLKRRDALGIWDTEKVHVQAKKDTFVLIIEVPMMA